jgi:hypothetical protein
MTDDDGQLMVVTPHMLQLLQALQQSGQLQLAPGAQLGQPLPTAMQGTQQGGVPQQYQGQQREVPSVEDLERGIVEPHVEMIRRGERTLADQVKEARRRAREPYRFLSDAFNDARPPLERIDNERIGWHLIKCGRDNIDSNYCVGGTKFYTLMLGYNGVQRLEEERNKYRSGGRGKKDYRRSISIHYSGEEIKCTEGNKVRIRGLPGAPATFSLQGLLEDQLTRILQTNKENYTAVVGDKLVFRTKYSDKDIVVEERDYHWLVEMYQQGVTLGQIALMMFGTVKDGGSTKSHRSVIDQLDAHFAGEQTQFYPNQQQKAPQLHQEAPPQLAGPQGQQVVYVMVQPSGNVGQLGVQGMQLLGGTNQRLITGGNDD